MTTSSESDVNIRKDGINIILEASATTNPMKGTVSDAVTRRARGKTDLGHLPVPRTLMTMTENALGRLKKRRRNSMMRGLNAKRKNGWKSRGEKSWSD